MELKKFLQCLVDNNLYYTIEVFRSFSADAEKFDSYLDCINEYGTWFIDKLYVNRFSIIIYLK